MKIQATKFVLGQISEKMDEVLPSIIEQAMIVSGTAKVGGYPFSRIIQIPNVYRLRCPVVEITEENAKYLKTGYVARTKDELPFLKRWFPEDAPVDKAIGDHLDVIMYCKEQLDKEGNEVIEADWGVVCINVETEYGTTPIPPTTMVNNQLGTVWGGNGELIDMDEYMKSVWFWERHALLSKEKK